MIHQGLQQTAAAVKAQFLFINLASIDLSYCLCYAPAMLCSSTKGEAQSMDGIVWGTHYSLHDTFMGEYDNSTHQCTKWAIDGVVRSVQVGIDFHFPVCTHPQPNAVFSSFLQLSCQEAKGLLDAQTPYNQINEDGMVPKDSWSRSLAFTKAVCDHIMIVCTPNSKSSLGSKIWCSFCTAKTLMKYSDNIWVEHSKMSSILILTSLQKERKA